MTIFERIIRREIPADIVYEDDHCVAFRDVAPQAPVHVLIVPRLALVNVAAAGAEHGELLGRVLLAVGELISCATPATSVPRPASRSDRSSAAWASRSRAIASSSTTVKTRGSPSTNCIVTSWRVVRWAGPRAEPHHDASPAGRGWARGRVAC